VRLDPRRRDDTRGAAADRERFGALPSSTL